MTDLLDSFIDQPYYNAANALQAATRSLAKRDTPKAHYVAFLGLASMFADTGQRDQAGKALHHYLKAAAEADFQLFSPTLVPDLLLGVGGYAYVFRVKRDDEVCAVKVLKHRAPLPKQVQDALAVTIERMKACTSHHVVHPISAEGLAATPAYFLMEYVDGVSLRQWIADKVREPGSRLPEAEVLEALSIVFQVAAGLKDAMEQGVVHLDLKPDNILIANRPKTIRKAAILGVPESRDAEDPEGPTVKVIDFSFLAVTHGAVPPGSLGVAQTTILYAAPEVIKNYSFAAQQSDMYSLGIILVEMLGGDVGPVTTFSTLTRLAQQEPDVAMVILSCLEADPAKRPKDWRTLMRDLRSSATAIDERVKYRDDLKKRFSVLAVLKGLIGPELVSYIQDLLDVARTGWTRAAELAAAALTVLTLTGLLLKRLFAGSTVDMGFLPCFIVSITFAWLQFGYFVRVVFRCRFFNFPIAAKMRALLSFSSFPFIWSAISMPILWPFASAGGVFVILLNNVVTRNYLRSYLRYPYPLFDRERERAAAIIDSYAISPAFWILCLVGFGAALLVSGSPLLWHLELGGAFVIGVVNAATYFTKVRSTSGNLIVQGTSLEYAIRASGEATESTGVAPGPQIPKGEI